MKNSKKENKTAKVNPRILIAAGEILILIAIGFIVYSFARKPVVAFYGLRENQTEALKTQLTAAPEKGKAQSFRWIELDSTKPLAGQIKNKRIDIIAAQNGTSLREIASSLSKKRRGFSSDTLTGMTSSLRGSAAASEKKGVISLPLLTDHYEIDIDTKMLKETGIKTIATWDDIRKFAKASQKTVKFPVVFAGKDGAFFISFLGSLTESIDGTAKYNEAVKIVQDITAAAEKSGSDVSATVIAQALAGDESAPFYHAVIFMESWVKAGLINPDSFNMSEKDVNAFMDMKLAPVVFMTLSHHRTVQPEAIERYASIYIPSSYPATNRSFTAPTVCLLALTNNRKALAAGTALVTDKAQETLSRASGLAPVLAHCRTPDHQADDVRYWIAATNTPLAGFALDAFDDPQLAESTSLVLAGMIRTAQ